MMSIASNDEQDKALRFSALTYIRAVFDPASDARTPQRVVLIALAITADRSGKGFAGQHRIAAMTGLSPRTVWKAMTELDKAGLITRVRRHRADGTRTSDEYTLDQVAISASGKRDANPQSVRAGNGTPTRNCGGAFSQEEAEASCDRCDADQHSDQHSDQPRFPASDDARKGPAKVNERQSGDRGQPDSNVSALLTHYCREFELTRGTAAKFPGTEGRAAKAFKVMLGDLDLNEAKAVVSRALRDGFTKRIQPWQILEELNRHLAGDPLVNTDERGGVQQLSGYDLAAEEQKRRAIAAADGRPEL